MPYKDPDKQRAYQRGRDRISAVLPDGTIDSIKENCLKAGESINAYIIRLVQQDVEAKTAKKSAGMKTKVANAKRIVATLSEAIDSIEEYVDAYDDNADALDESVNIT